MRKFIAVFALLAGTGFVVAEPTQATPSITVTGQGKVVFVPDLGYIQVGVASEGWTAAEAWQKNEAIVRKIFAALKEHGLEDRDLKTRNLSVQPRYLHRPNEEPKFLLLLKSVAQCIISDAAKPLWIQQSRTRIHSDGVSEGSCAAASGGPVEQ